MHDNAHSTWLLSSQKKKKEPTTFLIEMLSGNVYNELNKK